MTKYGQLLVNFQENTPQVYYLVYKAALILVNIHSNIIRDRISVLFINFQLNEDYLSD